jgi:hypothetical protein
MFPQLLIISHDFFVLKKLYFTQLLALPEKLDWMAASKFILDTAIQFKLGRMPPSELLTNSNSAARVFGHQV